jgi:methylated-DNA-[protein]-cysteine S-methyltransferase
MLRVNSQLEQGKAFPGAFAKSVPANLFRSLKKVMRCAVALQPSKMTIESRLGMITIQGHDQGISQVFFGLLPEKSTTSDPHDCVRTCAEQLREYFLGQRRSFTVSLAPEGTVFQRQVWEELFRIPFGEVRSYSDVARNISRPRAARAVGGANNANPVAIIIPCHRVIGKDRRLVGYGSGLWRKEWLLEHEQALNQEG